MTKEEYDKFSKESNDLKTHMKELNDRLSDYRYIQRQLDELVRIRSSISSNIRRIEVRMTEVEDFILNSCSITDELTQAIGNALDKVIAEKEEALRNV